MSDTSKVKGKDLDQNTKSLRYGPVIICSDPDSDGSVALDMISLYPCGIPVGDFSVLKSEDNHVTVTQALDTKLDEVYPRDTKLHR